MLLVDDHQADVGERRDERDPRPDDDVGLAGADPSPLVRTFALAEGRVQQRDADGEVGAEPVDDRGRQRDLRDEEQRGALGREAGGDRLDVDRRLAAARDALEERGRRVAPLDRLDRRSRGRRPGRRSGPNRPAGRRGGLRAGRPAAAAVARGPRPGGGPAGRARRSPMPRGARRAGRPGRRRPVGGGAVARRSGHPRGRAPVQRRDLARPERTPREALPGPQPRGRGLARGRDPQAALVSRPDGRPEQGPGQVDEALVGERAEPPEQARPGPPGSRGRARDGAGRPARRGGRGRPAPRPGSARPRRASPAGVTSATSSSRSSIPGGSIARITVASGAR